MAAGGNMSEGFFVENVGCLGQEGISSSLGHGIFGIFG